MGIYGQAAVRATENVVSNGIAPKYAWESAIAQLTTKPESRRKSCPRNAYLGLCESGVVAGIVAASYGQSRTSKNGQYALNAYRILKSNSGRPMGKTALWAQATAPVTLKENQQMDVVLALWNQNRLR